MTPYTPPNKYATMSWRGSENPDDPSGTAIFTVLTKERLEIPFATFAHAHQIFERMCAIAEMAHEDGRASIKAQIATL